MVDIMAYEKTTRVFTTLTLVFAIYVLSSKCGEAAARSSNLGSSTHSSDRSADNSRFKGLDKVLNRLDGASPDTTKVIIFILFNSNIHLLYVLGTTQFS